jgi:hypothetical protein
MPQRATADMRHEQQMRQITAPALTIDRLKAPMKNLIGEAHENISRYLFAHAFCYNAVGFLISRFLETDPQGKNEHSANVCNKTSINAPLRPNRGRP